MCSGVNNLIIKKKRKFDVLKSKKKRGKRGTNLCAGKRHWANKCCSHIKENKISQNYDNECREMKLMKLVCA